MQLAMAFPSESLNLLGMKNFKIIRGKKKKKNDHFKVVRWAKVYVYMVYSQMNIVQDRVMFPSDLYEIHAL